MCEICGGPLPDRGKRGPAPRYCSNRCRQSRYFERIKLERFARNLARIRVCRGCGGSMPLERRRNGMAVYCSEKCRTRHVWQLELAQRPIEHRNCAECGADFVVRRKTARFCSKRCWRRFYARGYAERIRNAQVRERFTLIEIAERDDWGCHICGGRVVRGDATVDHLVPLISGGNHTRSNVALAHRGCNSRRGARPLEELQRAG